MKTYTKANKLNTISMLALLWLGSFGVLGQVNQIPDWKNQNPMLTQADLKSVKFLDSEIGYIVGSGRIFRTKDGGNNWENQSSAPFSYFNAIHFCGFQDGWVVGQGGVIQNTTNGGNSWKVQTSNTLIELKSVFFIDNQRGWIVGGRNGYSCVFLKTTNGGKTWQSQTLGNGIALHSVYFINAQNGWAVGDYGSIYKTINGGDSWQFAGIGSTDYYSKIQFFDAQRGYVVGSNTTLTTTNGGISWQSKNINGSSLSLGIFINSRIGFGIQAGGEIRKTTDSGTTWFNLNSGTVNDLSSISFIDTLNGMAVGKEGTILQTTDGGGSWHNKFGSRSNSLKSMFFYNRKIGWSVGKKGTILKSIDGGASWQVQNSTVIEDLTKIYFPDSLIGYAVGNNTILKTTNGGLTWKRQNQLLSYAPLLSVYFSDAQNGCAGGEMGILLRTTNGGNTWNTVSLNFSTNIKIADIKFIDNLNGILTIDRPGFFRTTDGGLNWVYQMSQSGNIYVNFAFMIDGQNYFGVDYNGGVIRTSNGGLFFNTNPSSSVSSQLRTVFFINSQIGWAAGEYGEIIHTTNGGINWQIQDSGLPTTYGTIVSIQFFDLQNGIALLPTGVVLRTTNGGIDWDLGYENRNSNLNSVFFLNNNRGWAVGFGGFIFDTKNGGKSWSKKYIGKKDGYYDYYKAITFNDQNKGWIVGNKGRISKTENGGEFWQRQIGVTTKGLSDIKFSDANNGWIVGDSGTIFHTSNGGNTWQNQNSGTIMPITDVHFADSLFGWALGLYNPTGFSENSLVLRTTNGGIDWQSQIIQGSMYDIFFVGKQNGWLVGRFGGTYRTSDGGISWQAGSLGFSVNLNSCFFVDSLKGWAVSQEGTIHKTVNGGVSWKKQNFLYENNLASVFMGDSLHGWAVGNNATILTTATNNQIDPETPTTLITGVLSEKLAPNCNPSPIPIPNRLVKALPGPYYGISNNQGKYNLRLPLADTATPFTLQALENNNPALSVEVVCPPSGQITVTLDTIPDTLSNKDFGFEITPCHHLDVQIASNRRRRCFQNTTSISYQNQGSLSAPDAYLLVEFPHWVRPVSASRSHVALNDSVWRFNLDTVSAGESGSFNIIDSVLCGNLGILGLSQCTKATIFPAPDCPPPPGYNGAEVTVSGRCNDGFVNLGIYNKSNTDMADSVNYWVYLDSIQVKQAKVKLAAGDSLKLWVDTQGWAVHLTVNQVQNHPTELFVSTTVESCGDTFIFYPRQMVNRFAKQQTPNSKTHCLHVIGAYDPNDKQAFPIGFTNQNIIPPNTQLEYLVRFQNTGNDTAFTVYVIDTLDQNLNIESFEMGAASHNYQLSMQTVKSGKTFLRWQFNNIQLPDSNINEPASNGFIQYRISPMPNLSLGSKVKNRAEIYFDFNPPIITNQTLTTYNVITFRDTSLNNNVQIVTASKGKLSPKQIGVNLYPNPVTEHSLTADFQTKGSLTLFNAQGQLVYEKLNIEGKQVLPIQLRTGFYMAQLKTEKGVSVVKVVVE